MQRFVEAFLWRRSGTEKKMPSAGCLRLLAANGAFVVSGVRLEQPR